MALQMDFQISWKLVELSPDAVLIVNRERKIVLGNVQVETLFGYQREELLDHEVEMLLPERFWGKHLEHFADYFEQPKIRPMGDSKDLYGLRKNGSEFPVEISLLPLQTEKELFAACVIRDITPRKQAEETFRKLVDHKAALAEMARRALSDIDLSLLMNETVALVATTLQVEYSNILELMPDGDAFLLQAGIGWKEGYIKQAMVESGLNSQAGYTLHSHGPVIVEDLRTETRFGAPPLLHDHQVTSGISVIIPGQHRVFGVLGAHTTHRRTFTQDDVQFLQATANALATAIDRRRTEAATLLQKTRFQQLFENAPVGIAMLDENERILLVNKQFEFIFQFPMEEIRGRSINEIIVPEGLVEEASTSRVLQGETTDSETSRRRRDGTLVHVRAIGVPIILDRKPLGIYAIYEDLTERRMLEEQFRQAQKMEAIGRLAGGVAHDFNNLLSVILGYSELLMMREFTPDQLRKRLEEIHKAGEQASLLTRQLLAFSRKQELQPQNLDMNAVVTDLDKLLRRLIGEDIELIATLGPGLGRVKADPGQLEQVLMNLAVNARDAMPKGGMLSISTERVFLDEKYAHLHPDVAPGPYGMLATTDSGCGMDKETQARIFEPFFSTKREGEGTGLGLSTVYGIVKQSGGHISVYSQLGLGTTFKIYLPQIEEKAEEAKPARADENPYQGSETILVVEDEEGVRELACEFLEDNGYTVLKAKDGAEAICIAETHEGAIHLLITDVVMPGMSGREVADRVRALRPETKVLYMSGYTDDAIINHGVLTMNDSFLQKPFNMISLIRSARRVLSCEQ